MHNKPLLLLLSCILLAACGNNTNQPTNDYTDSGTEEQVAVTTSEEMASDEPEETDENQYEDFVPGGYTLYNAYRGNLNRDDYEDAIIILEPLGDPDDMTNRAVALLIGDADGKLTQAAYCKNGMLCKECGGVFGDPIADVVIKNGYFTLEHFGGSGWKWTNDPTFKYNEDDKKWYLHKWSAQSFHGGDPENTREVKIRTTKDFGKVAFEDFDIGG